MLHLDQLKKKQIAIITGIDESLFPHKHHLPGSIEKRLLEMGFVEGKKVKLLHEAPFSKDPIIVQIHNHRVALRRNEAHCILIQLEKL